MSIRMLIVRYCIWTFTSLSRLCGLTLLFNVLPRRGIGHLHHLPLKEKGGKVCLNKWIKYKCRTIDNMHQPEKGSPHWWLEILVSHLISRMLPSKGNWKMVSMRRQPVWVRIIFWKTKDCLQTICSFLLGHPLSPTKDRSPLLSASSSRASCSLALLASQRDRSGHTGAVAHLYL